MRLGRKQRDYVRSLFEGRCAYCGNDLPEKGWHADHVEPVPRVSEVKRTAAGTVRTVCNGEFYKPERNTLENIFPACAPCNLFKSVLTIEQFRAEVSLQVERARKRSVNYRTAERFGLIKETGAPVLFHFELINKEQPND